MHEQMCTPFRTFVVSPKAPAGEILVRASEILTEIAPKFNIEYASTIGIESKNDHAYLWDTTKIDFAPR